MTKEYSKFTLDLAQFQTANLSDMDSLGAISGSAMMCGGIPVLNNLYASVIRFEDDRHGIAAEVLERNQSKYLDDLYLAYSRFKLSEMHALREPDFVMPDKDSAEFNEMIKKDAETGRFIFGALAKSYIALKEKKYDSIKESLNKVKREILLQVRTTPERALEGVVIRVDGKDKSIAEYMGVGNGGSVDILKFLNKMRTEQELGEDALRAVVLAVSRDYYDSIASELPIALLQGISSNPLAYKSERGLIIELQKESHKLAIKNACQYKVMAGDDWMNAASTTATINVSYGKKSQVSIDSVDDLFKYKLGPSKVESALLEYKAEEPSFSISIGDGVALKSSSENKLVGVYEDVVDVVHDVTGIQRGGRGKATYGIAGTLKREMRIVRSGNERVEGEGGAKGMMVTSEDLENLVKSLFKEYGPKDKDNSKEISDLIRSVRSHFKIRNLRFSSAITPVRPKLNILRKASNIYEFGKKIWKKSMGRLKPSSYSNAADIKKSPDRGI